MVVGNTVYAYYKAIRTVLNRAVRHKDISFNPIHTVDLPKFTKPAIGFWEPEMIPEALKLFEGTEIEWHVKIALLTMLRESEICALHEDWFDFRDKGFEVLEQAQQIKGKGLIFTEPKSEASEAWLPLTDEVADLIRERKIAIRRARLKYKNKYCEAAGQLSFKG